MILLAACGQDRTVVKTEYVDRVVETQKTLDPKLTHHDAEPAGPAQKCKDAEAKPTVCGRDLANYIDDLRAWGRGMAKQLDAILGLQP
jgi:hypothetical protein